jgi:hypothetical protein
MAEPSKHDYPAKQVRRKELAEAADPLHANCRHPRHRISKQNS